MVIARKKRGEGILGGAVILGIAGGIGSGKSLVAGIFRDLGWVVVDSDVEAAAALRRPEVLAQLVKWWGASVLNKDGAADRSAIGRIVFNDPSERKKLEGLIHPLISRSRQDIIQAAERAADGRKIGVVFDAPLLFEAGLDAECDAVLWVEASRETRLARVRATRGWDEAELARREQSQWPVDKKRALCDSVIRNEDEIAPDGQKKGGEMSGLQALREQCSRIAGILLGDLEEGDSGAVTGST